MTNNIRIDLNAVLVYYNNHEQPGRNMRGGYTIMV